MYELFSVFGTDNSSRVVARPVKPPENSKRCTVYKVENLGIQHNSESFSDFDKLLAEVESDPLSTEGLASARKWVGASFYAGEPTLASLRLAAGLSQRQLADLCGMDQPHVSRYESGGVVPGLDIAGKMARALGVPLDTLESAWKRSRAELDAIASK